MSFLAPLVLFAVPAAALPLIIHLLRRRTAGRVLWGAWIFLQETMRKKRRKLMIEDIVLLVVRTLLIASAVLAFSRPFLKEISFFGMEGADKDVVIVIDSSASMRLGGAEGKSAFEEAVEEAVELVRVSPPGTSFGVVSGERIPAILTSAPVSDKREVTALLEGIKATAEAMDVPRTLAAAGEVLAGGNNPAKEVIIFGDGQGYGWRVGEKDEWARVERIFGRFRMRPPVIWRSFRRPEKVRNAAIAAVVPSSKVVGIDRPVSFTVSVVNSGSEAYAPGDAVFSVDGVEKARLPVGQILPGLSRTFSFSHRFSSGGVKRVVTALSNADDIASDSVHTNTVDVLEKLNVMIVDGRPDASGFDRAGAFVSAALSPVRRGTNGVFLVRPRAVRAAALENAAEFTGVHATVLCDVPMLSAAAMTNLTRYVDGGGALVNVIGPGCRAEFSTNALFAVKPVAWTEGIENTVFMEAPVTSRASFDEKSLPAAADVPWRYSDGEPACVSVPRGRGRIVTLGFPLDFTSTTLPARPAFVPFVHDLLYSALSTNLVSSSCDSVWRAREGDLKELSPDELDTVAVSVDLGIARSRDDAIAAVVGKGFGLEIWRYFAVLAFVLLLAEWLLCRRFDAERGGRVKSAAFAVLRAAAFSAIVWQLLHISWVHDVEKRIHRRVAVIADHSLSMQRLDAGAKTNLVSRAVAATNIASVLEERLSRRYDVEPFAFGSSTTDFAAALEEVLGDIGADELSGAVFITDGCDTGDGEIAAAARRFARAGARISTVIVGSVSNRVDAAVTAVDVAETVYLGDKVRPAARIKASGMKGGSLTVRFLEYDREIERREFTVDSDEWEETVRFRHDPGEKGVHSYRICVDAPEGDSEQNNDVWPFDVAVSDDRTNVLVADRRPRWEFRYLRNLFHARDKSVHLQYVITEPDSMAGELKAARPLADATRKFGDAEAGGLPRTYDGWRKFDVIILGDLPGEVLDAEACGHIRRAVEERGTMLAVIAGPRYMPLGHRDGEIVKMLPVTLTNSAGEVTARWETAETPFALTPAGAAHPATAVSGAASENERVWSSLPPASGRLAGIRAKQGSEVLLYSGNSTALDAPLLTVSQFGRGKVAFFAADETWRLRYRAGDRYHHRFWGNIINWGAGEKLRDGNRHARVGTDKMHVYPGESVKIAARFLDRDFNPVTNASPVAVITVPGGSSHRVSLVKRAGGNGYYEASFRDTESEGRYDVAIEEAKLVGELGESWPEGLSTYFVSGLAFAPVEYASIKADVKIPEEMARITGGNVYFTDDGLGGLDAAFGAGSLDVTERIEDPVWNHPAALALIVAALTVLWILRKRRGLA